MTRLLTISLALASLASAASVGRRHVLDPFNEILRHRSQQVRRSVQRASPEPVGVVLPDSGQIAVLDDGDGVFVPAGAFTLDQKTLQFQPSGTNATQYSYSVVASRFDSAVISSATALKLDDDDAVKVNLPFPFPFFGTRYDTIFVGSDGNATFTAPEASSEAREVGRLVGGPPRIAPLFADLNPTISGAAVSFVSSSSRFLVTWNTVPPFQMAPTANVGRETFQLALFPDGRIEFSYNGINLSGIEDGTVVGIAPGGATRPEQVSLVDFSVASTASFGIAIVEEFLADPRFDFVTLMQKFYRNHEDPYDYMVVFDTVDRDVQACAFASPIRNWVHGIGLRVSSLRVEEFDATGEVGSAGHLQNFVYMGPISRWPADPAQFLAGGTICGRNSMLSVLGQEAGHRFLAYPTFIDPVTGRRSAELLGRDFQHWSFFFHTDASVVEGNQIEDKGEGVLPRFETKQIVQRFSSLDQYLMGLRPPEDVPTSFIVRQPSINFPRDHPPQGGVLFDGTRLDITVPMIVAAEGPRAPDSSVAQKRFRFAFALLLPAGSTASAADIAKLDRFRTSWETFFAGATDNRAQAETRLVKQLQLSVWPAAGLIQGRTVTARVILGATATAPVTVNLSASSGAISVPPSVTVAAGSRTAEFTVAANSPGVAELTAQGPNDSFEASRAFLQVRSNPSGLRMERLESSTLVDGLILPATVLNFPLNGGLGVNLREPLIFRVRDDNFLPYAGVRLVASPSGGGGTSGNLITDGHGIARITWRLDTNPGTNTLNVSVEGQPDASVTVQAAGIPEPPRRRDFRPVPAPEP